ncbi:MAG: transglycosylase SLT domain-containing protein [Candidatus Komeilibacteria bacterium]|nr:transglycosylase SLT domain-containing protein [Candidatus Komeilibacteria bacterium]
MQQQNYWTNWSMPIITPKNQEWRRKRLSSGLTVGLIILAILIIFFTSLGLRELGRRYNIGLAQKVAAQEAMPEIINLNELTVWDRIRLVAKQENFDAEKLLRLAWCESRFDPKAVGDGGSSLGLFQINQEFWPGTAKIAMDVEESATWTINKLKAGQAYLWACSKSAGLLNN